MLLTPHTPQHGPGPGAGGADAPAIMALGESFQSSLEEAGRASSGLQMWQRRPRELRCLSKATQPRMQDPGFLFFSHLQEDGSGHSHESTDGSKQARAKGWMDGWVDGFG